MEVLGLATSFVNPRGDALGVEAFDSKKRSSCVFLLPVPGGVDAIICFAWELRVRVGLGSCAS